jgi:hypothetical protein
MTAMATLLHIEVTDPDDPMGMPLYGGDLPGAGQRLIPGDYSAYAHYDDGAEGNVVLTVAEDGKTSLRPVEG